MKTQHLILMVAAFIICGCSQETSNTESQELKSTEEFEAFFNGVERSLEIEEFISEINRENFGLLIDVRTLQEWELGYIEGAMHINYHDPGFESRLMEIPRETPLYFYCASGRRSGEVIGIARRMGFKMSTHLVGGINVWRQKGFDLVED